MAGQEQQSPRQHWWKEGTEKHSAVFSAVEYLDAIQDYRRSANLQFLRLYSNRAAFGQSGTDFAAAIDGGERIRMNVIKSAIDAATAQIATNRPRPMFLTTGGTYEEMKRAERLGKFIGGQFYALRQYHMSLDVFRDACVFGTGIQHIYEQDGCIKTERVYPDEIIVDDDDARDGYPRQMFRHKDVDKEVLVEMFPEKEQEILGAARIREDTGSRTEAQANRCSVIEAWHLPSGKEAKDGRHTISVATATLLDEPWERESFPFATFRWNTLPLGWYGIGAAEELASLQVEINYIAQKIQRLMTLATSMVWKEKGSGITKINNKDWAEREYRGKPPIFQTTAAVSAEYFNHLDRLYQRAFEIVGISQLAAQALKPKGLDSGEALRVYNDIGTRRFQHTGQRWEQFHLDVAEQILDCAREIEERGDGDTKVLSQGDEDVEEIKFSDVCIEKNKYVMRVYPTSLMPDTPAGKVEMLQKLAQVSPELGPHIVKLMTGIPDLESATKLMTAPLEIAEKMVSNILEHGIYEPPYPQMDLTLARDVATKNLLRAHIRKIKPEREELLRRYIDDIDALQAEAQAAMMPPPGMGPEGAAPGMEGLPPDMGAGLGSPMGAAAGMPDAGPAALPPAEGLA